ncbi:hypothetical protein V495_07119 [Pseudogymnoascus sp. VKM F-4514 (FW-929)]|nr:hypothetical protein V490_03481 [Pseudogymnoascus sp. VKM F-3557]KFY37535.1 hypothetical protein V495_07119 [Pseudogymnoascus sp. VKM F-4514 (FW-929)]KFY64687.1 hypothetical protein V497_01627 [Pseudogymnoascus sp. VKM F-4516 (FW-969)]
MVGGEPHLNFSASSWLHAPAVRANWSICNQPLIQVPRDPHFGKRAHTVEIRFLELFVKFTTPSTTTSTSISTTTSVKMARETPRSGIAVGPNKGHKTERRAVRAKPSKTKGHLSKRTAFVREIVKEVSGLAPYERRVIELLRNSKDKRARKLAKKRLGTFGRAKAKVDELQGVIAESRRTAH